MAGWSKARKADYKEKMHAFVAPDKVSVVEEIVFNTTDKGRVQNQRDAEAPKKEAKSRGNHKAKKGTGNRMKVYDTPERIEYYNEKGHIIEEHRLPLPEQTIHASVTCNKGTNH